MLDQNLVYQLQGRRNRAHVQLCCRRCSKVFGTWRHNLVAEALTKALTTECWRSILSLLRLPVRISWSLGKVDDPVSCHHECLNKTWQAERNFWAASATADIVCQFGDSEMLMMMGGMMLILSTASFHSGTLSTCIPQSFSFSCHRLRLNLNHCFQNWCCHLGWREKLGRLLRSSGNQ